MTSRAVLLCAAIGVLIGSPRDARAQRWGIEGRVGGVGLVSQRSAQFEGTVGTGSGTMTGLELSLRHRYVGLVARTFSGDFASDSGLAAVGSIRNAGLRLQLGPPALAAELGYGRRSFAGAVGSRGWGFLRLGARTMLPVGATGLTAELGLAVYAGLTGAADGGTSGREADTRLVYAPSWLPLYVALGYRAERFTVRAPSDTRPEAVSGILFAAGARLQR